MTKLSDLHCLTASTTLAQLFISAYILHSFPEYKTMVFNLVPNVSTHEGHFSNIRPSLINGKNR